MVSHHCILNCKVIKKRIAKIIFRILMGIFILIFLLVGALQIPYVQTKATQKAIEVLSEKLNYPIHIGGVDISWLDTAILDDVCIKDENKDTLLYIQETYIDFRLLSFLAGKTVIDNVFLVNPKMNILYQEKHKDLNLNHFIDAIMTLIKKDDNIKDDKKTDFKILTATLHNASFEYFHTEKDSIKHIDASKNFNYHHFSIVKLFTHLENFHITEDTVAFHIVHLSGHEKNNDFKIKDFNSEFLYTNSCLEFDELDAYIQNSFLSNKIRFDYKNMGQFSHFVDSVRITADLEKSIIYTKDLGYFAPEISKFDDKWTVSGQVRGTVSDLKLRDFAFSFGKQSTIQGNISLEGLPKIEETFMHVKLHIKIRESSAGMKLE